MIDRFLFIVSLIFIVMTLLLAVGTIAWKISKKSHTIHENSILRGLVFLITFFVGAGLAGSALRRVSLVIAGVDGE